MSALTSDANQAEAEGMEDDDLDAWIDRSGFGRRLASGSVDRTALVWDTTPGVPDRDGR